MRTRAWLIRLAVMAAVVLLGAGCGGKAKTTLREASATTSAHPSTTTIPGVKSACDLISAVDIKAALKVAVEAPASSYNGDASICMFATADKTSTVTLARFEPVGDLLTKTLASDPEAKAITSVVDEAVLQLKAGRITVRKGTTGFVLTVAPPPTEAELIQLARTVAGKA
jgi:hypothetical protein